MNKSVSFGSVFSFSVLMASALRPGRLEVLLYFWVSSISWRLVGDRIVTQFAPRLVFNVLEQARAFQTHLLYPYFSLWELLVKQVMIQIFTTTQTNQIIFQLCHQGKVICGLVDALDSRP